MLDIERRLVHAVIVSKEQWISEDAPKSRPPRGWYGDPAGSEPLRYWTGEAWADGGTDSPPQ
jgi:hypothetical protein